MYEIEITRFKPQPTLQKFSLADAAEASSIVSSVDDETAVIYVADIRNHVDCGNFYVWLCAGLAYVRFDEHREHYGSFRDFTTIPHGEAKFFDEDGSTFSASRAATISVASAKEALSHWLATGRATIALLWS
jgi:hypothetical protein